MTGLNKTSAEKLTVAFKDRSGKITEALKDVDFEISSGEITSIVGESGSGKTTLLRSLLGLQNVTSGKVCLFGKDLSVLKTEELINLRRRCGYIPQDPYGSLPPTLRVLEAVLEPWLLTYGKDRMEEGRQRSVELLARLGIDDEKTLSTRVRGKLSGGQRQRVAIARGLILQPDLLIADEPTSMQDASTRKDILDILKKETERGMAMIFVTHDLILAGHVSQKTMILYSGHFCEMADSQSLLKKQLHPYTVALYSSIPKLGQHLELKTRGKHKSAATGCPFREECPHAMFVCEKIPTKRERSGHKIACWKDL